MLLHFALLELISLRTSWDRAVVLLEARIALLPWFLVLAIFVEARNGEPGTICGGLPGLGVEPSGKGILLRQLRTIDLQVIVAHAAPVHPAPETLIADELDGPDGFVNGVALGLIHPQLVLVEEHEHLSPASWLPCELPSQEQPYVRCHWLLPSHQGVARLLQKGDTLYGVSC
jgi:hypothetical protein